MISVILPVLNDREHLVRCLGQLRKTSGAEVIVVDGGSRDGTVEAAQKSAVKVIRADPGRAGQMNAGAAAAEGGVLLFLHVDTILPDNFTSLVLSAVGEKGVDGGSFSFALNGQGAFYRFIERTANFRSRHMGVVFGDQAIFVTAEAFRAAGGYPDQPIMEDCALVDRLKRRGRFVILPQKATSSARRWQDAGPLRNTMANVIITWAYRLGVPPATLKTWYRRAMINSE